MNKNLTTRSEWENMRIINIMMYVTIAFFVNPYLLKDAILLAKKLWAFSRNNFDNVHYWKKQNNPKRKKL